jgi:hypothetical protein
LAVAEIVSRARGGDDLAILDFKPSNERRSDEPLMPRDPDALIPQRVSK